MLESASGARGLVAVTGASRGIGQALIRSFLKADWTVVACVRTHDSLPLELRCDPRVRVVEGRLDVPQGAEAMAAELSQRFPTLGGLVNNAAAQPAEPLPTATELAELFQLNVQSPITLSLRLESTLKKNRGFVANVSSGLAYIPQGRSPSYAATKAALSMYTKAARLREPELRFIEVILPLVDTDMTRGRGGRKMSPDEAARQIVRGVERKRLTLGVGKAKLLPLLWRLVPSLLTRLMNPAPSSL